MLIIAQTQPLLGSWDEPGPYLTPTFLADHGKLSFQMQQDEEKCLVYFLPQVCPNRQMDDVIIIISFQGKPTSTTLSV